MTGERRGEGGGGEMYGGGRGSFGDANTDPC